MATQIEIRNDLRVSVAVTDEDDAPVDPDELSLEVAYPEGSSPPSATFEYPTDTEIERTDVGEYRALLYIDTPGNWTYTWVVVHGGAHAAKTGCFEAYEGCTPP